MSTHSVYKLWLDLQCQMISGCHQGILVKFGANGKARVLAQWPENKALDKALTVAAQEVSKQHRLYLSKDSNAGAYLGHPIEQDGENWGVIVVHLNQRTPTIVQAVIKLLKWGATWLHVVNTAFTASDKGNSQEANASHNVLNLITQALQDQSLEETAITTVNHIASSFRFDRVTLGLIKNGKIRLQAMSFQAQFDKRSELSHHIPMAMEEAYSQGENLEYPHSNDHIIIQHKALAIKHGSQYCASFLLKSGEDIIGVVCAEKYQPHRLSQDSLAPLKRYIHSVAHVLALRQNESSSTPKNPKSSKLKDRAQALFQKQFIARWVLVVLGLIFMISWLPIGYKIKGDAVIQSNQRHLLAAPFDGYLSEVLINPGDKVEQGQIIAKLKDDNLELEKQKLTSQIQQLQLEFDNALSEGKRAQAAIVTTRIDQAKVERSLIEQKLKLTQLAAPTDGMIVSDEVSQSVGAPVSQGSILFEIADAEDYNLHVWVSERDITYLKEGEKGQVRLSSLPGETFEIQTLKITPISEVKEGDNFFRVEAEMLNPSPSLRPGMRGDAKLFAGKKRLGWIWFHRFWHRIRLVFWI